LCLQGNKVSTAGDTRILWVGGDYGPSSAVQFQNNRIVTSKVAWFIHIFLTLPPLWSSGPSSWLQIQRPLFDFWHYQLKLKLKLKLKLVYDRQSVGQSGLVSGVHVGSVTNFSFFLKFPLDSCGFVVL
jgi:hypothetical protein